MLAKLNLKENVLWLALAIFGALFFAFVIAKFATLAIAIIPVLLVGLFLTYFILRRPELGWLLIVFFLPFERVPTISFAGVDLKINTILGFITLFAWILALMFNAKKYPPARRLESSGDWRAGKVQPNALAIPLSIFVIAMMLSLSQAVAFGRAIQVLIFILFTIALSILAVNMVYSKETLKKTLLVLFASSFLVGIFGLFQFGGDVVGLPASLTLLKQGYGSVVFGFPRVQAFSMEPLYLANYLLIPIGVGLALFFNRVDIPLKRWWLIILLALLLVIFVLTVSRGGYLGLVGTFLVIGILLFRRVFTWKNVLIGVAIVAIVGYGVVFALSKGEARAVGEFLGHVTLQDLVQGQGESVEGRLKTFRHALNAWRESPIFGQGIGNYGPWNLHYPNATPPKGWDIVNNEYIEIMAETGLVGLIAYSLLLIVLIFRTFSAYKYVHDPFLRAVLVGLLAALIGILIQYNFMSTLYIIHIWVAIGLLIAVQNIILKTKNLNGKTQSFN